MSRYHSYINSAGAIIDQYNGDVPFAIFIKKYFVANKKMGSRDRKTIASLCYSYFRVKHLLKNTDSERKFLLAIFLCDSISNPLLAELDPSLNDKIGLPAEEKLRKLDLSILDIFPFVAALSEAIDADQYCMSYLEQPLLYLRLRPGKENVVIEKLEDAGIPFQMISSDCIAIENSTSVAAVIQKDREAVVQDINSQNVFSSFKTLMPKPGNENYLKVWDCCAASGGKSILWMDTVTADTELAVSDIRKTILANLSERFAIAGIKNFKSYVADLTKTSAHENLFDTIICDAPCTGSGTWSRTPEQLAFFKKGQIREYADKQKSISVNAAVALKKGGHFFYITCSVFRAENEEVVEEINKKTGMKLLDQQYLKGYDKKADTLFVALFKN